MKPIKCVKLLVRARAVPLTKEGGPRERGEAPREVGGLPWLRLTFDTETETEVPQRLRFGSAVLEHGSAVVQHVVFFGEGLSRRDLKVLEAEAAKEGCPVLTRREFIDRLLVPTLEAGGSIQGLNLRFDLGAIAEDWSPKERVRRKRSFQLYLTAHHKGPRVRVESIGGGKVLFSARGLHTRSPGSFLDVRQLHRAIYGVGSPSSLEALSRFYNVAHPKLSANDGHGKALTSEYVRYAIRDPLATAEVASALRARWEAFGLELPAEKVYSGASIAKAAWRARGLEHPPRLDPEEEGRILSAYFAGRAEAVKVGVTGRVAVLDFTSQYPTLWALQGLGEVMEAESLTVATGPEATARVKSFIESTTLEDLLQPATWRRPEMRALVRVRPHGEVLPARWKEGGGSARVYWPSLFSEHPLYYAVADVLAAKMEGEGGTVPEVLEARLYTPGPRQASIRECAILGRSVPRDRDLMVHLTEQRVLEKRRPKAERDPMFTEGVKPIINSGTYGIGVEERVVESPHGSLIFPGTGDPYVDIGGLSAVEGAFFSPLVPVLITSGSHLLLSMMGAIARGLGARVVYMDTDSGFVTPPERAADIAAAFQPLNPFSVPTPVLKEETEEKAPDAEWPGGERPRGAYPSLFAASAKRYALYTAGPDGMPAPFTSGERESGLGPYRTPDGFKGNRREFVRSFWTHVLREEIRPEVDPVKPDYFAASLVQEVELSTPSMISRFRKMNRHAELRPFCFAFCRIAERGVALPTRFKVGNDVAEREHGWRGPSGRTWEDVVSRYGKHHDGKRQRTTGQRWVVRADGEPGHIDKESHLAGTLDDGVLKALEEDATGHGLLPRYHRLPDLATLSVEERKKLGIPKRTWNDWRARLRAGKPLPKGHGANPTLKRLALATAALEKLRSGGGKPAPHLTIESDRGHAEVRAPLEIMEGVSPDTNLAPLEGGHSEDTLDLLPGEDPVAVRPLDGEAQPGLSSPLAHPAGKLSDEKSRKQAGSNPPATSEPHPEKERLVEVINERAGEGRREPIPLLEVEPA